MDSAELINRLLSAARVEEAKDQVLNEFSGLDLAQQYRNAFARLLKPDPLARVDMLGTDQRDRFVPVVREHLQKKLGLSDHVLDIGGGDGQTFSLLADALPAGTTVSLEEPNKKYAERYWECLGGYETLLPGDRWDCGFDDWQSYCQTEAKPSPQSVGYAVVLSIHMAYFVDNVVQALVDMANLLKVGGSLIIIVADEADAYTGHMLRAYYSATENKLGLEENLRLCKQRRDLLSDKALLIEELNRLCAGKQFVLQSQNQPSRLYGHSLVDMVALCNIAELADIDDVKKFEVAATELSTNPELYDLTIETDSGPRYGMLSVKQPQIVTIVTRKA